MNDNVFIDTNILIYFVSNDEPKKIIAKDILIKEAVNIISSQVIGEFVSVTRKKKILPSEDMQHNQLIDRELRILNPFV